MLTETNDGPMKFVCPECGRDGIGESGLGSKLVHCFAPSCTKDFSKESCEAVPVTSQTELQVLRQPCY